MSIEQDNRPFGIPGMHRCDVHEATMPGIIILVHGVNSDGEWYEETEKGLIEGLNKRLGFDRAKQPDRCQLVKAEYAEEVLPGGKINRQLDGDNFITDPGRSPVIRFRWGYKIAGQDSTDPNAGCLGVMLPLAVSGWISGLIFSIRSVTVVDRFKMLAWIILLCNALGVGLSVLLYFMIITR